MSESPPVDAHPGSDTCPECGGTVISQDGDAVYDTCGLLIEDEQIDHGPEWRGFDAESRRRTGPPRSQARHDNGLGTQIGHSNDDSSPAEKRQCRHHDWAKASTSREETEMHVQQEMRRLCDQLDLSTTLVEQAGSLYKSVQSEESVSRPSEESSSGEVEKQASTDTSDIDEDQDTQDAVPETPELGREPDEQTEPQAVEPEEPVSEEDGAGESETEPRDPAGDTDSADEPAGPDKPDSEEDSDETAEEDESDEGDESEEHDGSDESDEDDESDESESLADPSDDQGPDDDDGAGGAGAAASTDNTDTADTIEPAQTETATGTEDPGADDEESAFDADLMESHNLSLSSFPARWEAETTARHLRTIIDAMRGFVDEARLFVTDGGLVAKGVDKQKAGMAEARLNASGFSSFDASPGAFGVPLDRFKEAISMAESKDSTVSLSLDERDRDLVIAVDDVEYTLGLLAIENLRTPPEIGALDLQGRIEVEAHELKWALNGLSIIASEATLSIDVEERAFRMEAVNHAQNADYTLGPDEDPMLEFEAGEAESRFDVSRLQKTQRGIPSKQTPVTLALGNDFPIKVAYEFCDGHGSCLIMLAPLLPE